MSDIEVSITWTESWTFTHKHYVDRDELLDWMAPDREGRIDGEVVREFLEAAADRHEWRDGMFVEMDDGEFQELEIDYVTVVEPSAGGAPSE